MLKRIIVALSLVVISISLEAQEKQEIYDYMNEGDFVIGGISVSGVRYLDLNALIGISGLKVGQQVTIPGDAITNAAKETNGTRIVFRCKDFYRIGQIRYHIA